MSKLNFKNKSAGISFIEIMISLLLVSIVVLGVLANHSQQTKQTIVLKQYMLGSIGLRNLAERMLANPSAAQVGFYQNAFKANVKDCITLTCNSLQIAEYDINQTTLNMQEYLPEFEFKISSKSTNEHTITANWQGIDKDQLLKLSVTTP